jgi:hypothetical protein
LVSNTARCSLASVLTISLFSILTTTDAPAAEPTAEERLADLEKRMEAVTAELEQSRLGGAADTARYTSRRGFAPAASKVYNVPAGVTLGGYGEMLLEKFDSQREDDVPANRPASLDYLRQVLYVGYKFNDELLFNSEIEFEHAGIGGAATGEVVLEFAYIDWARRREFGIRGGLVLLPVGLVNELHEPPVVLGARRPDLETEIIPTTWRGNGAGAFGEWGGGFSYRGYVTEGLNARGFTAARPLRGGRQVGSRSRAVKPGFSGRVDWAGVPGLTVGVSGYTGNSWQENQRPDTTLTPWTTVLDVHARVQWRSLEVRALWVDGRQEDAGDLSDVLGLTGSNRLGERFGGWYVEAQVDLIPWLVPGSIYGLLPYARYERYDTQDDVPGGVENLANERTVLTAGAAFKPHPNVVLKADYQHRHNEAETGVSQWNAQLGYMF